MKEKILMERIPGPLASLYEKATRQVIENYYSQIAEEVVSDFKEGLLLDLGTGPGYLPIEIVRRSPKVSVIGIDLSRSLLKMARKNAKEAGLSERLSFRFGQAADLPFNEATFDMILSTGMLHMLKKPVQVFLECYRVLKNEGTAWFFDPAQVSSLIDKTKWKDSLNWLEKLIYRLFPLYTKANPSHFYDQEEVLHLIKQTDFKIISLEQKDQEIRLKLKK